MNTTTIQKVHGQQPANQTTAVPAAAVLSTWNSHSWDDGLHIDQLTALDRLTVLTQHSTYEIVIVSPANGEVLVRGDSVMAGYWRNPEATAAAVRDGWLWTGDVGSLDDDGFLTLKDRSKDLLISGGSNIYPREVEEVLLKHANVREASVIGRPHPEWGEVVVAYVVGDVRPRELDELCLGEIARFKRPKDYVFVDALPKNNYGKILKTELRELDAKRREKPGA